MHRFPMLLGFFFFFLLSLSSSFPCSLKAGDGGERRRAETAAGGHAEGREGTGGGDTDGWTDRQTWSLRRRRGRDGGGRGLARGMRKRGAGVEKRRGKERHRGWTGSQPDRRRVTRA